MTTCTLPRDQLERVTHDDMSNYLRSNGWHRVQSQDTTHMEYWHKPGTPFQSFVAMPRRRRFGATIQQIAQAEDRCPREVLIDILGWTPPDRLTGALMDVERLRGEVATWKKAAATFERDRDALLAEKESRR